MRAWHLGGLVMAEKFFAGSRLEWAVVASRVFSWLSRGSCDMSRGQQSPASHQHYEHPGFQSQSRWRSQAGRSCTGSHGAPGRAGHAPGTPLCPGDCPRGGPRSPGERTPCLLVALLHAGRSCRLRGWEVAAAPLQDEHLPQPSPSLHLPVKLISSLMSHLVRDCKGYLDPSGDSHGELESLTLWLKFFCLFWLPVHPSNASSLLLFCRLLLTRVNGSVIWRSVAAISRVRVSTLLAEPSPAQRLSTLGRRHSLLTTSDAQLVPLSHRLSLKL